MKIARYHAAHAMRVPPAVTPALTVTSPPPGTPDAPPTIDRWIATPREEVLACAGELEVTFVGMGVPDLTTAERRQVDTGLGLTGECAQAIRVVEVIDDCPEFPHAPEARAAFTET